MSPPLAWSSVPPETRSLLLVADDPDAGGYTHWLVYDIPPQATGLPEGVCRPGNLADPPGARQGTSDGPGAMRYVGNDPPPGETHRYRFTLYALDTMLEVGPGPDQENPAPDRGPRAGADDPGREVREVARGPRWVARRRGEPPVGT